MTKFLVIAAEEVRRVEAETYQEAIRQAFPTWITHGHVGFIVIAYTGEAEIAYDGCGGHHLTAIGPPEPLECYSTMGPREPGMFRYGLWTHGLKRKGS